MVSQVLKNGARKLNQGIYPKAPEPKPEDLPPKNKVPEKQTSMLK